MVMEFLNNIISKKTNINNKHYIFEDDCLNVLQQIDKEKIKLIITDPPYNIGLKYNNYNDRQKLSDYLENLKIRINEMSRVLTKDGSLYIINYPEINARLLPLIEKSGLIFRRWLTWHYPTNIGHSKNNFTRSQRSVLFYTKTNNNTFNKNAIIQPYKNPNVSKIKKRIEEGKIGRTPYDTFTMKDIFEINYQEVPDVINYNLLKNTAKSRAKNHPCQLPKGLIKILIKASSVENDIVMDCYAGAFTTCLAAKELNRNSVGIEIDSEYFKIGYNRLRGNDET